MSCSLRDIDVISATSASSARLHGDTSQLYRVGLTQYSLRSTCAARHVDIYNAWDRHEPIRQSRTASCGAQRVHGQPRENQEMAHSAVRDTLSGLQQAQVLWSSPALCARGEQRSEGPTQRGINRRADNRMAHFH